MRLASIASGSSGNCVYVGSDVTHLLIDVGISGKKVEAGLNELGVKAADLDGIFITHEHIDHIGGLGVIARRYGIPMYATAGTIDGILQTTSVGEVDKSLFHEIQKDSAMVIKDIIMNPMHVSHDASDPVAYRICHGKQKIGVITDLGNYDDYTIGNLQGMDALFIEANHDIRMLQVGPYPYYLKQRILGDRGHLSNERSGQLLSRLLHDKLKAIILGHLSKENNMAELAYETVRVEIGMADNDFSADDFPIHVAKRSALSDIIYI